MKRSTASNVIDLETFRQTRSLRLVDEPRGSSSDAAADASGSISGNQAAAPNMMLWFCWVPVWTFVG